MPRIPNTFAFDADAAREHLGYLGGDIHLVAIHRSGQPVHMRSKYFGDDIDAAVDWAEAENRELKGIYVTINRVPKGFDRKPSDADIVSCRFVHVDLDPPHNGTDFPFKATLETFETMRCPPSFIVKSGGGLQAWFRIEESQNKEAIRQINLQVRHLFDADACQDVSRLFRLAGTCNFVNAAKAARGRKDSVSSIIEPDDGTIYEPHELAASFPPAPEAAAAERKAVALGSIELLTCEELGLGAFHFVRKAVEKPKGSDRSAYGYHAAAEAVRHGLTDNQIAGLLLNPANEASGHFIDQSDPMRAIKRAIGAARGEEDIAEGDIEIAPVIDFTAMVANASKVVPNADIEPLSAKIDTQEFDWYSGLRGGMKEMVDTILRYAPSPRPELALGAALSLFATACGRRYQTPSGLMTNLYIVGLSPSGSGKDLPVNAPGQVLMHTSEEGKAMVGGSEVVSARGIMTAVEASPTLYLPIDEMGKLVQAMHDPRGHLKEAVAVMLKLYSQSQSTFKGAMYANSKERPTTVIERPCLGFYGVSNPKSFWEKLTRSSVSEGLLPRFILLPDDTPDAPPPKSLRRAVYSDGLKDMVKACLAGADNHETFPMGNGGAMSPKPFIAHWEQSDQATDEATGQVYSKFDYWMRCQQHELLKSNDPDMHPFIKRMAENANKIALVKCASENPAHPILTVEAMQWGWELSKRSTFEFIAQVEGNVSENEHEAKAKAVEAAVKEMGDEGATLSHIGKKCAWISGLERSNILDDLVERHVLSKPETDKSGGGRPVTRYWVA